MVCSADVKIEVVAWRILKDWDVTKNRFNLTAVIYYTPQIHIMFQSATLTCQLISPSIKHLLSAVFMQSW